MSRRRVLITAGASGIGLGLAKRFAAEGDRVAVCDADATAIERMQAEFPDFIAKTANVTDEAQMDSFLAEVEAAWGGVDVVCANAGTGGPAGRIEDLDYNAWRDCVGVNLFGAFLTCRWAARIMRAQGAGLIILTSSTAGTVRLPAALSLCRGQMGHCGAYQDPCDGIGPGRCAGQLHLPRGGGR